MKSGSPTVAQRALSLASSSFLLLVLTSLDFLSFGTKLLSCEKSHGKEVANVSGAMFLYSTIAAQLVFGMASGLGGVCAGAIFEAQRDTRRMHELCSEMSSTFEEEISNTYACIFASTGLYALLSYALRRFRVGGSLRHIPVSALYGVMASIGMMSVECGYEEVYSMSWQYVHVCFALTVAIALLAMALDIAFPTYFLMIPILSLGIVGVFYGAFGAAGLGLEWMRSVGLVPQGGGGFDPLGALKHLSVRSIKLDTVKANLWNIIGLSLFNLVHIAVNVPSFAESLGVPADLDRELGAQSLGNVVSAFLGYPTYFICSTSIYFNKSGGRSRIHSMVGVLAISSLLVVGGPVREVIPVILSGTIPMFIGFGFLYSYLWGPMLRLSLIDIVTLLMSALASWYLTPVCGLVVGMAIDTFYALVSHLEGIIRPGHGKEGHGELDGTPDSSSTMIGGETYRVADVSCLMSLGNIVRPLDMAGEHPRQNLLLDLRRCRYLGVNANMALEKMANAASDDGWKVAMIGTPRNLYIHLFSKYMVGPTATVSD